MSHHGAKPGPEPAPAPDSTDHEPSLAGDTKDNMDSTSLSGNESRSNGPQAQNEAQEVANTVPEKRSPQAQDAQSNGLSKYDASLFRRVMTPKNCRWNNKSPPAFTNTLCVLYAISTSFTVANLYYNQPILNRIAQEFGVTYEQSSQVATLLQAGYAAGLILILPLGDLLERRMFIISLVFLTASLWIVLCITESFTAFRAISFICGATTVTPQLMIPLVGDFAPANRKGQYLSIVVSGLLFGMFIARLLSGVVTNFTSWRNIYWFACGAQYLLVVLLYCFMPDYPSTNPEGLNYFRALMTIPYFLATEPVLIQSCLMMFCLSSTFTSYWTTLTFLLASPPYEYSSLVIGLFSLLNIVAMVGIPLYGRVIDRFVPLFSILIAQCIVLTAVIIGTFTGNITVAGPIIQAVGIDIGIQTAQVANRASIFSLNPKARNRLNTAYMASAFSGQLTGTAVGNRLYASGGWTRSGACSIGLIGASMLFALARGPRETGWVGWKGGWRPRKDGIPVAPQARTEANVEEAK